MKHLELARKYFESFGRPLIEQGFPQLKDRYAAGLVGEGSGCFGFDDDYSQDHDFAPGFCIWLTDEDFDKYGAELQKAYDFLPVEFEGFSKNNIIDASRLGVMRISDFYASFTGCPDVPETTMDWFLISETNLSVVTNGEVFEDKLGDFTRIRNAYKAGYPKDVLLKKLAARACVISQAGQYNYQRCLKRSEKVAAALAASRFAESVMSMVYLLNSKPAPFYKWIYRGFKELPSSDEMQKIADDLKVILTTAPSAENILRIEAVTSTLINMLINAEGLEFAGYYMQDYAPQLMEKIQDPELTLLHPMADCQ